MALDKCRIRFYKAETSEYRRGLGLSFFVELRGGGLPAILPDGHWWEMPVNASVISVP